jgi:hypothetical protein
MEPDRLREVVRTTFDRQLKILRAVADEIGQIPVALRPVKSLLGSFWLHEAVGLSQAILGMPPRTECHECGLTTRQDRD